MATPDQSHYTAPSSFRSQLPTHPPLTLPLTLISLPPKTLTFPPPPPPSCQGAAAAATTTSNNNLNNVGITLNPQPPAVASPTPSMHDTKNHTDHPDHLDLCDFSTYLVRQQPWQPSLDNPPTLALKVHTRPFALISPLLLPQPLQSPSSSLPATPLPLAAVEIPRNAESALNVLVPLGGKVGLSLIVDLGPLLVDRYVGDNGLLEEKTAAVEHEVLNVVEDIFQRNKVYLGIDRIKLDPSSSNSPTSSRLLTLTPSSASSSHSLQRSHLVPHGSPVASLTTLTFSISWSPSAVACRKRRTNQQDPTDQADEDGDGDQGPAPIIDENDAVFGDDDDEDEDRPVIFDGEEDAESWWEEDVGEDQLDTVLPHWATVQILKGLLKATRSEMIKRFPLVFDPGLVHFHSTTFPMRSLMSSFNHYIDLSSKQGTELVTRTKARVSELTERERDSSKSHCLVIAKIAHKGTQSAKKKRKTANSNSTTGTARDESSQSQAGSETAPNSQSQRSQSSSSSQTRRQPESNKQGNRQPELTTPGDRVKAYMSASTDSAYEEQSMQRLLQQVVGRIVHDTWRQERTGRGKLAWWRTKLDDTVISKRAGGGGHRLAARDQSPQWIFPDPTVTTGYPALPIDEPHLSGTALRGEDDDRHEPMDERWMRDDDDIYDHDPFDDENLFYLGNGSDDGSVSSDEPRIHDIDDRNDGYASNLNELYHGLHTPREVTLFATVPSHEDDIDLGRDQFIPVWDGLGDDEIDFDDIDEAYDDLWGHESESPITVPNHRCTQLGPPLPLDAAGGVDQQPPASVKVDIHSLAMESGALSPRLPLSSTHSLAFPFPRANLVSLRVERSPPPVSRLFIDRMDELLDDMDDIDVDPPGHQDPHSCLSICHHNSSSDLRESRSHFDIGWHDESDLHAPTHIINEEDTVMFQGGEDYVDDLQEEEDEMMIW